MAKSDTLLLRIVKEKKGSENVVKIKVSYEHDYELHKIRVRLAPMIKRIKIPKEQKGAYKKAYIELENVHSV